METTNKSTSTLVVDEAVFLGYNIEYTYQFPQGETKPTKVVAKAVKSNTTSVFAMPHETIIVTVEVGQSPTIQAQQATDKALVDAMETKCLEIINEEEV